MSERIFLPARRDGGVQVLEYWQDPEKMRRVFVAVARAPSVDAPLTPTGALGLDAAELARCSARAAELPGIERALKALALTDSGSACPAMAALPEGILDGEDAVIVLNLYLELQKHISQTERSFAAYDTRAPQDRAVPEIAGPVYLSALRLDRLDWARGAMEADRPAMEAATRPGRDWAYLWSLAAAIAGRAGDLAGEVALQEHALAAQDSAERWLQLGWARHRAGDRAAAAAALVESHARTPLAPGDARRLAWWFLELKDRDAATRWCDYVEETAGEQAPRLRQAISELD